MYILDALFFNVPPASAQIAPTEAELRAYSGPHAAAARGDVVDIKRRIASAENKEAIESRNRYVPEPEVTNPARHFRPICRSELVIPAA